MAHFVYPPNLDSLGTQGEVTIPLGGTSATEVNQAVTNLGAIHQTNVGVASGLVPTVKGSIPSSFLSAPPNTPDVTVSGPVSVYAGSTNLYTITNYDSRIAYAVSTTMGVATVVRDQVTYTAPGTGNTDCGFVINGKSIPVKTTLGLGDLYSENTSVPYGSPKVAISADGLYAAFGQADFDSNKGRVLVYHYDGAAWVLFTTLLGTGDGTTNDALGNNLSFSGDGSILACACPGINAVKVFTNTITDYSLKTILTHGGPGATQYGQNVVISKDGNYIVTNQYSYDPLTNTVPFLDVYQHVDYEWHLLATLRASSYQTTPADHQIGAQMDISVDGSYLVVRDHHISQPDTSTINVFRRDADRWTEEAEIALVDTEAGHALVGGLSISADASVIVSGSTTTLTETAYVFKRASATWDSYYISGKLAPQDGVLSASAPTLSFGYSVAVNDRNDRVFITGFNDTKTNDQMGAVWVFDYDHTQHQWFQRQVIRPLNGAIGDHFGMKVVSSSDSSKVVISANTYSRFYGL